MLKEHLKSNPPGYEKIRDSGPSLKTTDKTDIQLDRQANTTNKKGERSSLPVRTKQGRVKIDTDTDRRRDRQTAGSRLERRTDTHTQTDTQTGRQTDRQADRQTDRHTDRAAIPAGIPDSGALLTGHRNTVHTAGR